MPIIKEVIKIIIMKLYKNFSIIQQSNYVLLLCYPTTDSRKYILKDEYKTIKLNSDIN